MTEAADPIRVRRDGEVLRITLCDPAHRNAQRPSMWRQLAAIGADLDPAVRVVLLDAEGPSFSAGLDRRMLTGEPIAGEPGLAEIASGSDAQMHADISGFQEAFTWWSRVPAVTIAAVQGHAIGAGAQLMLACDLALVADDLQFALRETSLGMVPDLAGTGPLVRRVGYHRALAICATGRAIGADEAIAIGLAEFSVPRDGLTAAAEALIAQLLAAPPDAVRAVKPLLLGAAHRTPEEQRAAERAAQLPLLRGLMSTASGEPR